MNHLAQLNNLGFSIVQDIYSYSEVAKIRKLISEKELESFGVLKSKDLFAIRQLLLEIPELKDLILNEKMNLMLKELQGNAPFFLSKAIYFDKPKDSNWFVAYHQDLTINVSNKSDEEGFTNWTNKRGQIGVQPPIEYLNRTVTIRIHLDDTDEFNGALRVLPRTNTKGVIRVNENLDCSQEIVCKVNKGGVMLMKPLTLHASSRSTGNRNRRVIHLEFCNKDLPDSVNWKEKIDL